MLGLCVVTWFLLPRTLGLRRSRKTSGNLCHPSGEAAGVRRLASPLLLSPGVWEDTDTGGTHSRTALRCSMPSLTRLSSVSLSLASVTPLGLTPGWLGILSSLVLKPAPPL